ncbi:MAG: hypothetical protein HY782_19690 [Chloroflexi bacterium]|nr:hypothetical protein [Chloroflexota bacterium]
MKTHGSLRTGSAIRRNAYILSIWEERPSNGAPVWRGCLETASGERTYFASLADLSRLLQRIGGWMESSQRILNE